VAPVDAIRRQHNSVTNDCHCARINHSPDNQQGDLMYFGQMKTPGGYLNSEVTSALQKSIRRGLEEEALFWGSELDLAGFGAYVWKRLRIIASEDIGLADPTVCVQVRTLYENWVEQRKNKADRSFAERLFLVHAILICVRAKKSRIVDSALITMYEGERAKMDIPNFALDVHTAHGRRIGRGVNHFFDEGAMLANEAFKVDPYRDRAQKARKGKNDSVGHTEQLDFGE